MKLRKSPVILNISLCLFCVLFLSSGPKPAFAEKGNTNKITYYGRIADKNSGKSIAGCRVKLTPEVDQEPVTGPDGKFTLYLLPGDYTLKIIPPPEYHSEKFELAIKAGEDSVAEEFFLYMVLSGGSGEKIIEAAGPEAKSVPIIEENLPQISRTNVQQEEIQAVAGGMNDITRVIKTMPGVVSGNDYSGEMYVRGGDDNENTFLIDGFYLFNPYHLGSFVTIFNLDVVEKAYFQAGGFTADVGQTASGLLEIKTIEGNPDGLHFIYDVNLIDSKVAADGPAFGGRGSYVLSARRTYYDLLLDAMGKDDIAVPHFGDSMEKFTLQLNDTNKLTMLMIQAEDGMDIDLEEDENETNPHDEEVVFESFHFKNTRLISNLRLDTYLNPRWSLETIYAHSREETHFLAEAADSIEYDVGVDFHWLSETAYYTPNPAHEIKFGVVNIAIDIELDATLRAIGDSDFDITKIIRPELGQIRQTQLVITWLKVFDCDQPLVDLDFAKTISNELSMPNLHQ